MKRRMYLSIFLLCSFILSLCACGNSEAVESGGGVSSVAEESSAGTPQADGKVKLRIAIDQHDADVSGADFIEFKNMLRQAEEELGYEIEYLPLRDGQTREEQLSVMLAGDLPDIFWGLLTDGQIVDNAGLFVPIEDKIETHAPDVYRIYEENVENWREFLTYPDGHIYGMMTDSIVKPNNYVSGTMWINKAWLDQLSLEIPTTMTELKTVLAAFRDNDLDGDGDASNEIPLDWCQSHYAAKYAELAHCFGLPIGEKKMYDIVDGKVVSTVDTEVFRAFLEEFHQMAADGLINAEGTTQTNEQYTSNISSGKVGAFWGWAPYTYITDTDLQSQYVPVAPISADGTTFRVQPDRMSAKRNGFVITTACENVEAAMTFWNYLSKDEERQFSAAFGPEGLMWEFVDETPTIRVYTEEEAVEFGFESIASNAGTSAFAASVGLPNCGPLMLRARANVPGSTSAIRWDAVKLYEPYFTEQSMSQAIVPADVSEEFSFTTDGLEDYINAFACDAALNGVTDESWDAYIAGLPQYGYDHYLTYYQNYLDGTF